MNINKNFYEYSLRIRICVQSGFDVAASQWTPKNSIFLFAVDSKTPHMCPTEKSTIICALLHTPVLKSEPFSLCTRK